MAETYWNAVYAHRWTKNTYALALKILQGDQDAYRSMSVEARRNFMNRLKHGYVRLKEGELGLRTDKVPKFLQGVAVDLPLEFKVVHPDNKTEVINSFVNGDPELNGERNLAMNYKSLYDKIVRAKYVGITRSDVSEYLKATPRFLRQLTETAKRPFVKSYRPRYPFQHWQMDHMSFTNLKGNEMYTHVLVIIDIFSKYTYLFPVRAKGESPDADSTIACLQKLFLGGDIPETLGSDNGTAFKSKKVVRFCKLYSVKTAYTKPHNPQTNGFAENKVKQVKRMVAAQFVRFNTTSFFDILDQIAFTINNTKHSVTAVTPMELHRGRVLTVRPWLKEPDTESGDDSDPESDPDTGCWGEDVKNYKKTSEQLYKDRIKHAQNRIDAAADKREVTMASERSGRIRVGMMVRVATWIPRGPSDIQPVQLLLTREEQEVKLKNPLYYNKANELSGEKRKKSVRDVKYYARSLFKELLLKSNKWAFSISRTKTFEFETTSTTLTSDSPMLFRVVSIEQGGAQSAKSYKLVYNSDQQHTWTVRMMTNVTGPEYTKSLPKNVLMIATEDDIAQLTKPAIRPDYRKHTIDLLPKSAPTEIPKTKAQLNAEKELRAQQREENRQAFLEELEEIQIRKQLTKQMMNTNANNMNNQEAQNRTRAIEVQRVLKNTNIGDDRLEKQFARAYKKPETDLKNVNMVDIVKQLAAKLDKMSEEDVRKLNLYIRYAEKSNGKITNYAGLIIGKLNSMFRIEFEAMNKNGETFSRKPESKRLDPKNYNQDFPFAKAGGWTFADLDNVIKIVK